MYIWFFILDSEEDEDDDEDDDADDEPRRKGRWGLYSYLLKYSSITIYCISYPLSLYIVYHIQCYTSRNTNYIQTDGSFQLSAIIIPLLETNVDLEWKKWPPVEIQIVEEDSFNSDPWESEAKGKGKGQWKHECQFEYGEYKQLHFGWCWLSSIESIALEPKSVELVEIIEIDK